MMSSLTFWIAVALQTVLAGALCFVPLFDLLAYEFCLATALLAAITATLIGYTAGSRAEGPGQALRHGMGLALLHLAPSLVIISLNALRVRNCNFAVGLAFFTLLPVATSLYGGALGVLVARLCGGLPKAVRGLVVAGVIVGPFAWALWLLYSQPPIFSFDHLWGYFAGSLYDESIVIDTRLLMFRVGTVVRIAAMSAIVVCWERWARLGTATVFSVLALSLVGSVAYDAMLGPIYGFRIDRAAILARLPNVVERPNLVIHLPTSVLPAQAAAIADDHAFRLSQLLARLHVTLDAPIHSYVYTDAAEKAFLMGGRNTMIAKPWLHEIHVHSPQVPHPVVPHELAHAVAASFGSQLLGVSARHELFVNMGLVEGLAEALTPVGDELDIHHWARAMRDLKLAPNMRTILGPAGFWTQAPRRAYTVAGSFVSYLLEKHGAAPLKAAYANGDFETAYGSSLDTLVSAWETFLGTLTVTPREQHIAAERFRMPSIFARTCAHEIAQLAWQAERSPPLQAVALRQQICVHLANAPAARLDLAYAMRAAGDADGFLGLAKTLLAEKDLNAVQRAALQEARSETFWDQGRPEEAQQAAQAISELQISLASERLQWVRLWAMSARPPALSDTLLHFLGNKLSPVAGVLILAKEAPKNPQDRTFPYLIARQLHRAEAYDLAIDYLSAGATHPFAPIETERLRLIADSHWRLGHVEAATKAYQAYAAHALTSGEKLQAQDWLERLAWQTKPGTVPKK